MQTVRTAQAHSNHLPIALLNCILTSYEINIKIQTNNKIFIMFTGTVILLVLVSSCYTLSIGAVSDKQNVTKREANNGEFYPDWVPFKNKNGEQLGEFVQVEPKAKPKKRLAPPVNFILRAVAEPEGDDYYDKGQGESENDDYYEKQEDANRAVQPAENKAVNHTDISDIDGVVDIIVKPNPITEVLKARSKKVNKNKSTQETNDNTDKKKESAEEQKAEESKKEERENEDYDDDNESSEKQKAEITEKEKSENEAKKARILDSVDELKVRHAEEQRAISEKVKEEEEHERDTITSNESADKYDNDEEKPKKTSTDYKEYEEKETSQEDKYKINPLPPKPSTRQPKRTARRKSKKNKNVEDGKSSVFKNPRLYIVYNDEESAETTTTLRPRRTKNKRPEQTERFSSRYTTTPIPEKDESVRISLVPQETETKEEPTLFFPKKRKTKRRRKTKTTPAPDSYVAETVEEKTAKDLITAPDTTASDKSTETTALGTTASAVDTAPSAQDTVSTNTNPVTDAVPASSDHKKEEKHEDYHREKGGGRQYHSEHEEEHEEHGKKAYEGVHKDTKTAKGHHDKENHHGKYNDHGGYDKEHHEEQGHYGAHHHEEHGKKHAKYEESGKHAKGHSTKGSHDIHKKEEYEKKVEFFEEEGDSGEEEKHGGHNHEREHSSGGHFKKGNLNAGHHEHAKGDSGHFGKGGHTHVHKGHRASGGHDSHGKHGHEHHQKETKDSGKKWVYHHGHPAKTANLVVIDRRGDKYYHGPQYYG